MECSLGGNKNEKKKNQKNKKKNNPKTTSKQLDLYLTSIMQKDT
jgi:hypothetical protein